MTEPLAVLGTAQLGSHYGVANRVGRLDRRSAAEIVREAEATGYDAIDTAPSYGDAEEAVGLASTALPVYSKASGPGVRTSVERSLGRLRRDHLDVLFLHDPDIVLRDPDGVIDEAAELVGSTVATIGASVYTLEQLEAASANPIITWVQVPVNAADRRLLDANALRAMASMRILARSAFLQGALLLSAEVLPAHLTGLEGHLATIGRVAADNGLAVPALLLAFAALAPGVDGVIVGCETIDQMRASLAAIREAPKAESALGILMDLPSLPDEIVDPRLWPESVATDGR